MKRDKSQLRRLNVELPEFRVERRDDNPIPLLIGYAARFNVVADLGWFTEEIAPGAFADSISRPDDVRALFNHDSNFVLGRNKAGTLALSEDEKGLLSKITPPDTTLGRDLIISVERGDINQMSFGFYVEEEEAQFKNDEKTHFIIKKARLFDVSIVTFPAYEETEVDVQRAYRSRFEAMASTAQAANEKRKRELNLIKITCGQI